MEKGTSHQAICTPHCPQVDPLSCGPSPLKLIQCTLLSKRGCSSVPQKLPSAHLSTNQTCHHQTFSVDLMGTDYHTPPVSVSLQMQFPSSSWSKDRLNEILSGLCSVSRYRKHDVSTIGGIAGPSDTQNVWLTKTLLKFQFSSFATTHFVKTILRKLFSMHHTKRTICWHCHNGEPRAYSTRI